MPVVAGCFQQRIFYPLSEFQSIITKHCIPALGHVHLVIDIRIKKYECTYPLALVGLIDGSASEWLEKRVIQVVGAPGLVKTT